METEDNTGGPSDAGFVSPFQIPKEVWFRTRREQHHDIMNNDSDNVDDAATTEMAEEDNNNNNNDAAKKKQTELYIPTELWAYVMDFLSYQDMLQCGGVNRFFLHQVMPLLRSLEIIHPHELHIAPLGRFSNVTDVNITCLVRIDPQQEGHLLSKDTAGRLVHFLSNFPRLERAWVGGRDDVNYSWSNYFYYDVRHCQTDGHEEVFRGLIRSVCGAYRAGVFCPELCLDGIICADFDNEYQRAYTCNPEVKTHDGATCELCHAVCRSFPLDWVMKLRQKRRENLQEAGERDWFSSRGAVCLLTRDRISTTATRPGGVQFLRSPSAISCCLAKRDSRDRLEFQIDKHGTPRSKGCYNAAAIDLSSEILDEIRLVLEYGLNPRHVKYDDIVQDYWSNREGELPIHGSCYMTRRTFDAFVQFGFSITDKDFYVFDWDESSSSSGGWQENQTKHPNSVWEYNVPGAWQTEESKKHSLEMTYMEKACGPRSRQNSFA